MLNWVAVGCQVQLGLGQLRTPGVSAFLTGYPSCVARALAITSVGQQVPPHDTDVVVPILQAVRILTSLRCSWILAAVARDSDL